MSAGFNTLSIAHRIDEFVFDCSFDSLAQANALEPEMSALLTAKLLPVIDAILDEFDQADTVWRLDQVEIDLGDIASGDFYAELVRRVQEKLRERLRRLQEHHQPSDSVSPGIIPPGRLSKMQTDLEMLQDFLLTGRMPWPADATDRHAHENLLRQILQQQDAREAWIMLLRRLTAAQRTVAIGRLVAQFSYRSLESVLTGIAPADAHPLLDFLRIYQQAMSGVDAKAAIQTERIRLAWEQLFKMLLESRPSPGNWTILLDQLVRTIVLRHAQESSSVLQSISRIATQYHEEGKISGAFHAAWQTLNSLYLHHPQHGSMERTTSLTHRNGGHDAAQSRAKGITRSVSDTRKALPETTTSPERMKQVGSVSEELYTRIVQALQKAGLIDAGFASMLMELASAEQRQRLRSLLQSPAVKPRLPRLPQAVLLDISYWLSPPAALLMERLLAHAGHLYQLPGATGHTTQKHWKQQRWSTALDYLLREADSSDAIDPAGFLRALAHGVHGEAAKSTEAQITLHAWHEALVHRKPYNVIAMLLFTLIGEAPEQNKQAEKNAAQSGKSPEENTLQQPLHKRLTTGKAVPGQQDLKTLLQALASGHPEQLRQLYQDLRNGRYDLTAARLNASELHSLIEKLLHIQSGGAGADWPVFLQAIEAQADRTDDPATYYRLILEDLLQEREIDLEAIAALARQPLGKIQDDEEDRSKRAGTEEVKRAGEAEGTETAEKASPEVITGSAPYAKEPSTETHTGHAALYSRITAALHKAGLIDEHPEAIATKVKPEELRQRLRAVLHGIDMNGWVEKLPQSVRMEIAYLLSPQAALLNEHLLAHADKLQRKAAKSTGSNRKQWEQRLWKVSLNYLLTETSSDITPAAYVQALARGVAGGTDPQAVLRAWYETLEQSKTSVAIHTLLRTIAETLAAPLRMNQENKENPDSSRSMAGAEGKAAAAQKPPLLDWDTLLHRAQSADDVREEIYIENAGQVLAAPYLPRLFSMLKLVEDGAFIDRHAAERAVHLLQFMVNEQTRSPEFQLTLNKILCGVTTGIPICREIDISTHEQETIEGLIRGMIQNWKIIGNTSISGLRETFLQRKGRLQLKEDGMWYLTVEPGVFDMLLDSLPWSFSVIKHGWMERAVHVTWR